MQRIGILTGGGDCAGLNAVIEASVKIGYHEGIELMGIRRGWEGLILNNVRPLSLSDVEGIHSKTGTILLTSRTNPYKFTGELDGEHFEKANVSRRVIDNATRNGLEGLILCGGDDTLSVVPRLIEDYGSSIPMVGIPKTMDGDLQVYSLGLDTAINRAKQTLEDFVPILKANSSIGIVEFFGRDVGRVTFKAGIAAGADVILLPEVPSDLDYICEFIADLFDKRAMRNGGESYVLIAIAEGTSNPLTGEHVYLETGKDSFGNGKLGGVGDKFAKLIQDRLKDHPKIKKHVSRLDIKSQRPTYDVRGGATNYSDSYIGQKLGAAAVQYLKNGAESGMAVINFTEHSEIELMSIKKLIEPRPVHIEVLKLFENSGLYCFGRRPDNGYYAPTVVIKDKTNSAK